MSYNIALFNALKGRERNKQNNISHPDDDAYCSSIDFDIIFIDLRVALFFQSYVKM